MASILGGSQVTIQTTGWIPGLTGRLLSLLHIRLNGRLLGLIHATLEAAVYSVLLALAASMALSHFLMAGQPPLFTLWLFLLPPLFSILMLLATNLIGIESTGFFRGYFARIQSEGLRSLLPIPAMANRNVVAILNILTGRIVLYSAMKGVAAAVASFATTLFYFILLHALVVGFCYYTVAKHIAELNILPGVVFVSQLGAHPTLIALTRGALGDLIASYTFGAYSPFEAQTISGGTILARAYLVAPSVIFASTIVPLLLKWRSTTFVLGSL